MDLMSLLAKLTLDKTEYDKGLEDAEKDAKGLDISTPKLELNKEKYKDSLDEAQGETNVFKDVVTGVWQGLKDSLISIGVTGVILGVAGALKQGVDLAITSGKQISDNSKNLQLSTRAYQEYNYTLGKSGIQVKELSKAMKTIDTIRSGKITEDQTKYLGELGISAEDAKSGLIGAEDMLNSLMTGLSKYSGADKGAIIDAFFGTNDKWTGYFTQTEEEISKLKREADSMGLIMSDESIENAVKFSETTEKLTQQLDAIKRSFGETILPVINSAVEGLAKIVAFFSPGGKSLSDQFKETDKSLAKDLVTIEGTSEAAMGLVDKLFAMGEAEKLTAEQQEEWRSTAQWLIDNIPSLSDKIDLDTLAINGNKDALIADIEQWKNLAKERALAEAKEKKYKAMLDKNADAIDKQAEARAKANEVQEKYYQKIAAVNDLIEKYPKFAEKFTEKFGVSKATADNPEIDKMLRLASSTNAFMLQSDFDNSLLHDLEAEYTTLVNEQARLQEEADKYKGQLEEAQTEYEGWLKAVDEMYGITSSTAEGATSDVDALKTAIDELPSEKDIYIRVHHSGKPERAYASGSSYIPYDQLAYVHRGEQILTASQARQRAETARGLITARFPKSLRLLSAKR